MNKEKRDTDSANKPQIAFIVLFCALAYINFISMVYDNKTFADQGSFRVGLMSVLAVVSIVITLAVFVLYFLKILRIKSLRVRYFLVSLCCVGICAAAVYRGSPYIQDIKEGTSVVVTNDYWYYMGNDYIEFTDTSGKKLSVRASNLGEMTVPLIVSQFFSNDQSETSDKKNIYVEYYPHSRTVVDIHMEK